MSIFAKYAKLANAKVERTPLEVTSQVDPLTPLSEEEDASQVTATESITEETAVESVKVDVFAEARERLNQTHHNLIRGRSQIVEVEQVAEQAVEQEDTSEVTQEADPEIVQEETSEVVQETEITQEEATEVTQEADAAVDAVSEDLVAEADPMETPVDAVPEDEELPEEPALDVTAEEEVVVEEPVADDAPAVVEEPVVVGDEVAPADVVEEVEEPIDHDIDDNDAEVKIEMSEEQQIDLEQQELESLEMEMNLLAQSMFAVETYGINPTAVHIMQVTGLLDGTAIQTLGLEAFGYEAPDHPESQMALEALSGKIKEKAAQWSAKVISMASSFSSKTMGVLNPLWDKITSSVSKLSSASWDKAKEAGKVVRAHPYKTIIVVILAIAAVAGVVLFGGQALPAIGAKQAQVTKFVTDMASKINKIKWPFGDIKAVVAEGGAKFAVTVKDTGSAAKAIALDKLDWTATMVKSAGGQLGRAWTVTKQGVGEFGDRAGKIGKTIAKSGFDVTKTTVDASTTAGVRVGRAVAGNNLVGNVGGMVIGSVIFSTIISTVVGLTKLVYRIIAGGLRIIAATFNALIGGTTVATA